jgi:hypothetical protein
MTKQEILEIPNLAVAEEITGKFVHIHAEYTHRITCWKETDDIKDYIGSVCVYFPIKDEYPETYRTITKEEHEILLEKQRNEIEKKQVELV